MADPDVFPPADDPAAALFARLRDDPAQAFDGPGVEATERAGHRRRRARLAAVAAAVVAAGLGAGFLVRGTEQPDSLRPVGPAATASSAPVPTDDDGQQNPLKTVDWANATLGVPGNDTCGGAPELSFTGGLAHAEVPDLGSIGYAVLTGRGDLAPRYAELTDDGVKEAIVTFRCSVFYPGTDDAALQYYFVATYRSYRGQPALSETIAAVPGRQGPVRVEQTGDSLNVFTADGTLVTSWQTN